MFNNIILIGLPGSGKSTCGRILAEMLQCRFLDSDQIIEERCRKTISEIFAQDGESCFRQLETQLLLELAATASATPMVLATGGGLPVAAGNFKLLQQLGKIVYLYLNPEEIAGRLKDNQTRPLLRQEDSAESLPAKQQLTASLSKLLQLRAPAYNRAQLVIDAGHKDPQALAKEILTQLALNT